MATRKTEMDLLTAVEQIVEKAKGSKLNSEFYRKAGRPIKYMSEKMQLTKEQCVMMALFIDNSAKCRINISEFGKYLDCRTTRIIKYMTYIDELEKRELVRCCREDGHITYSVPFEVIDAFKRNENYVPKDCSGLSCMELFGEMENIFNLRSREELTYEMTAYKLQHLFDCNRQLLYVQKVKNLGLNEEDEMLLILFTHLFVNDNDDHIGYHNLNFLFEKYRWNHVKSHLNWGDHLLLTSKLVEYNNDNGFVNRESFRMTMAAKRELFGELNLASMNLDKKRSDMLKHEEIIAKQLFYDEKVAEQVCELGKLLNKSQYSQIHTRMKDTGFSCAFTCLFYGAPGTGKTETVFQLARQTGRDILQVNISQIKSMWVGESEKNIKQVFDTYREKVKSCETTPILLFNEADAIIGKRREGAEYAVDKMENTIQNIILQEMETLDGILIATTNLAQNMDKAFERRFLYKVKFERPTIEARMSIWHEMIPSLSDETTRFFAERYDFSGGQIENIARHYTIGNILHGAADNVIKTLLSYCDQERLETREQRRVGF